MNQYFFNVTKEERENILDKHKTIYDGYVTEYGQGNMYPLTVQDMANDKRGITVNNKGEVSEYKNVGINEMRFDGKSTGLFQEEENNYMSVGAPLDMIADRQDDVDHGTVDFENDIEFFDLGDVLPFDDGDYDGSFDVYFADDETDDEEVVLKLDNDFDEDLIEPLQEQLDRTREMFLRFKNY
jgi:hypothetical protein